MSEEITDRISNAIVNAIFGWLGAIGVFIILCIITGYDFDSATLRTKTIIIISLALYAGKP